MEHFKTWWEHITGPRKFLDGIAKSIDRGVFCVVLRVPGALPWSDKMRALLLEKHIDDPDSKTLIDIDDANAGDDLDAFLYDTFVAPDESLKRAHAYKFGSGGKTKNDGVSIGDFLLSAGAFKDKIVWIKNVADADRWHKHLISKYNKKFADRSGTFILETTETGGGVAGAETLAYLDCASKYDAHLFASIAAASGGSDPRLHQYITFAAGNLYGPDETESMAAFINETGRHSVADTDIVKIHIRLSAEKSAEDSTERRLWNAIKSSFPIASSEELGRFIASIERKVWRAQIQAAFPLIEEEREKFIDKYYHTIMEYLPIEYLNSDITDPYKAELGAIKRIFGEGLRVEQQDYKRFHLLYDLRNKLAHLKCCTAEEMGLLLVGGE